MIDLRPHYPHFIHLLRDTLKRFESQHPSVKWSCFAFDAAPVYGFLRLNFDTAANSNSVVTKYQKNGPAWYQEDAAGRFNNNCADFEFSSFTQCCFDSWEEEFIQHSEIFTHIDLNGEQHTQNMEFEGNEGFNKIIFELLESICSEQLAWVAENSRNRASIARLGVQICDSEYEQWALIP